METIPSDPISVTEVPSFMRPAYPTLAQSWGVLGWFLLLTLLLGVPLYLVLDKVLHVEKQLNTLLLTILTDTALILVLWRKAGLSRRLLPLTGHELPWLYAFLPLLVFAYLILLTLLEFLHLPNWYEAAFRDLAQHPVLAFFMLCVAAPVFEELIFRGIVLSGLLRNYHPWVAIGQSALLFGLVHMNPAQIAGASLMGLLLGWLYHRTRSLRLCMAVHALNNLVALIGMMTTSLKDVDRSQELFGSTWGYGLAVLGSGIFLFILLRRVQQATHVPTGTAFTLASTSSLPIVVAEE